LAFDAEGHPDTNRIKMNITIKTIPHKKQRYPTCGDWWFDEQGNLQIRVSDVGNPNYEALVALHEMVEALLCKKRGITAAQVDTFDKAFEASRQPGNEGEPGDDPKAPYRKEHFFATNIEALMSEELGVDWQKYEEVIDALP
jgi:hypothetical protein